jgi:hypothetical protein
MKLFLTDQHGWTAHDRTVKVLMGLGEKDKWPKEGLPPREVQGIRVWVKPIGNSTAFYLRAMCECPICHKKMPIGRLKQHSKVHTENLMEHRP